ncbi:hypothetical protein [Blastococcus saxobsidens]|uniref:Uncharacterized protein n=1 Tax=Blastococcus saxobsidens TaxID=138336 RepID=A0A4Q7Y1I3_9ACTN|nr:hypothetical protein [Blastococcus saxobsidens]RZU30647.1 hypothetical protein BKA19_0269 [Blastococcus saxobsidens]
MRRPLCTCGAQEHSAGGWLPAQRHSGENIGDTDTHVLFVELTGTPAAGSRADSLGPG